MTRSLRLLPILVYALLLSGCSGVRVAYNSADFLVRGYADNYLGLDGGQMARWSSTLNTALVQHREHELPFLAAFFDSARNHAREGFTDGAVACLLDQFEVIYRRHFTLAAETAAPLLAGLDSQQIDTLERTFRKEAREDAGENAPENTAQRERKRAKRYEENMRWWIGELTDQQRAIVGDVTSTMPETSGWYAYRDAKRRELITLLRAQVSAAQVERFLIDWLVEYRDMPAALTNAQGVMRHGFTDLLVRLDATLDPGQQRRLIGRLTSLREDFMALQHRARMAPVGC